MHVYKLIHIEVVCISIIHSLVFLSPEKRLTAVCLERQTGFLIIQ